MASSEVPAASSTLCHCGAPARIKPQRKKTPMRNSEMCLTSEKRASPLPVRGQFRRQSFAEELESWRFTAQQAQRFQIKQLHKGNKAQKNGKPSAAKRQSGSSGRTLSRFGARQSRSSGKSNSPPALFFARHLAAAFSWSKPVNAGRRAA